VNTDDMIKTLEGSGDYRILRRLNPRDEFEAVSPGQELKTGVLVDLETTGLDTTLDEVIELGLVKFAYLPDDRVAHVVDTFGAFNEPTRPIPPEVTELTGITAAMVAGHCIDSTAVAAFISDAVIVIAHNAAFDRPIAERYWPEFVDKAWACSANQIEWRKEGFEGSRLAYLLAKTGMFHDAHRAVDDCRALLEILASTLPKTERCALSTLLSQARRKTVRIWAEYAPFELKNELKKRRYRWSDGSDGRPRSWYVDVDEADEANEIAFLCKEIYCREVELRTQPVTALTRFSNRN
jgi:DNA polymerase-3 subunit epsilon